VFRITHFQGSSQDEWDDWQWQLSNRITTLRGIERILQLSPDERNALREDGGPMPFAITPYYASLLAKDDPTDPLRRSVIPVVSELRRDPAEALDPLGEDADSPVPGIIHRYPDRVLFLVTSFCSVNCRYCTRSRIVGSHNHQSGAAVWEDAIRYIERTTTIRDVLLSGGDPLTLSDERLKYLLGRIRRISHVEVIRIGTKVPVVLPQRITARLVRMLHDFHPLWMSIHFTHPEELTQEVKEACSRLADAGLPLGSQTVLLRGINDDAETMGRLVQGLMRSRVRPYYIYQCDPILGSSHFRTPVERGVEIIRRLRGFTSGYAIPQFVIDAPGGGGKIPVNPDYVVGRDGDDLILRNYEGGLYRYPDLLHGNTG
jgi:lysine 2,3-aminomutase